MAPRFRPLGVAAALLLAQACADPATQPTASVDGLWDWAGSFTDPGPNGPCADTGSLMLHQQGSSVTGTAEYLRTCFPGVVLSPGQAITPIRIVDSLTATISGNTIITSTIRLVGGSAQCTDTLVYATSPVETLMGTGACPGSLLLPPGASGPVRLTATRGGALASVRIVPDSAQTVVGGGVGLGAELRVASGARVFERSVVWSSSNSAVATVIAIANIAAPVASTAVATSVGPGSATITATAMGVSGMAKLVVPAPIGMVAVSAGDARTCGLDTNGNASCWGLGVGLGTAGSVPAPVPGGVHLTRLSVGHDFACGLTSAGAAYCWGTNGSGQLGNGLSVTDTPAPTPVMTALAFTAISAGYVHACALTASGAVWCWGDNGSGRLGNASTTASGAPVRVMGGITFQSISAGRAHSCGVAVGGTMYCWGENVSGQLGDSTTATRTIPTRIYGAYQFATVSAGSDHTCGLTPGGVAYCWGNNSTGQLGNLFPFGRTVPDVVAGGHVFATVSAAWNHTCGLDAAGAAWCWGSNGWGQLGTGSTTMSATPSAVTGGLLFTALSAGYYSYSDESINGGTAAHTCGVTGAGLTYCWGVNNIGQVGNGQRGFTAVTSPAKVAGQP